DLSNYRHLSSLGLDIRSLKKDFKIIIVGPFSCFSNDLVNVVPPVDLELLWSFGPIPDNISNCGEFIGPADKIISFLAYTVLFFSFFINSTPNANLVFGSISIFVTWLNIATWRYAFKIINIFTLRPFIVVACKRDDPYSGSMPLLEKKIESSWYFGGSKFSIFLKRIEQLKFSIFLIVLKVIKKNPKSLVTIFFYKWLKFEFIRNMSKLQKFFLISYSYSDKKIIRIHRHNFFLLAFEVQILTKTRQIHEYLQIIILTNHLRSESSRSTPLLNVQQSGTHLPTFFNNLGIKPLVLDSEQSVNVLIL
ncbi:hypothetical protein AGLY_008142, partial [Aphis glycines]